MAIGLFGGQSVFLKAIFTAMITFLKTILIVLLIYFGLKFLIRLLTPYILRYISKKAGQQFEKFFGNQPDAASHRQREGDITIERKPQYQARNKKKVGEYVDFEEIE